MKLTLADFGGNKDNYENFKRNLIQARALILLGRLVLPDNRNINLATTRGILTSARKELMRIEID